MSPSSGGGGGWGSPSAAQKGPLRLAALSETELVYYLGILRQVGLRVYVYVYEYVYVHRYVCAYIYMYV